MKLEGRSRISGATIPLEVDANKCLIVQQGGKYAEATLAGRVFNVANQAAVAMTAALATTYTGLAVGNPVGSGVNLSLLNMGFGNTILGISVGTVGLMGGAGTITAALTPAPAKLGAIASKATATGGQTISTPVLYRVLGTTGTAPINTWQHCANSIDLDGSLVVTPGYFIAVYHFMLSSASLQLSLTWEEVPIS